MLTSPVSNIMTSNKEKELCSNKPGTGKRKNMLWDIHYFNHPKLYSSFMFLSLSLHRVLPPTNVMTEIGHEGENIRWILTQDLSRTWNNSNCSRTRWVKDLVYFFLSYVTWITIFFIFFTFRRLLYSDNLLKGEGLREKIIFFHKSVFLL